jgi:large subunit ribosomal protein L28
LQHVSFPSEALGLRVHLRLTAQAIRTIEKNGGLDTFLATASSKSMSAALLKVRKAILKRADAAKTA